MASVKVPRLKMIDALESALKKTQKKEEQEIESYKKAVQKYEKDLASWQKDMKKWEAKWKDMVPAGSRNVRFIVRPPQYTKEWIVEIECVVGTGDMEMSCVLKKSVDPQKLPQRPEKPYPPYSMHNAGDAISDIKKILKLLEMSEDETVSTSLYKNVINYL